ncbi:MAG: L28 family ribosomal protein [Patescibacteria group bacterium]
MNICEICGKKPEMAFNRPHSLHHTKRVVKPNIQKKEGINMCTRCMRTVYKKRVSVKG